MSVFYSKMLQYGMLENKYSRWYFNIINSYNDVFIPQNVYCENHHIMPKCIEIDNSSKNLIRVRMKDHVILHHLLTKMFEGDIKHRLCLGYSMTVTMDGNKQNPLRIERAKKIRSETMKGKPCPEKLKRYLSKINKGKKLTEEHKQKIGNTMRKKDHYKRGQKQSIKTKQKISKLNEGGKNSQSKLTDHEVYQIKYNDPRLYESGGSIKIAKEYGVKPPTIYNIKNGHKWKHI